MQCTNGDRYGGRPARAVLALGTSEALARAFAQQGSVNDGIGAPLVAKERGGAETSSSALGEPRRWSEAKANGTRMLAKFVDDNFHDGNFSAPRAPASERAQHEAEPGYDPELGAAPEFTVGLRWAGATNVCDPAGSAIAWPWESNRDEPFKTTQVDLSKSTINFRVEGRLPLRRAPPSSPTQ